jgi:hypothetical protein
MRLADAGGPHARCAEQRAHADRCVHQEPELAIPGRQMRNRTYVSAPAMPGSMRSTPTTSPSRCSAMRSTRIRSCSATRGKRGWVPLTYESLMRAIELNAVQVDKNLAAFEWGRRAAHDLAAVRKIAQSQGRTATTETASSKIISLHTPKALDTLIDKRADYLTAMAERSLRSALPRTGGAGASGGIGARLGRRPVAVDRSRGEEPAQADGLQGRVRSRASVRRSGFHRKTEGKFRRRLEAQFHLAPPAFSKKDSHGHLVKKKYGPWMSPRHARARETQVPARHRRSMYSARRKSVAPSAR